MSTLSQLKVLARTIELEGMRITFISSQLKKDKKKNKDIHDNECLLFSLFLPISIGESLFAVIGKFHSYCLILKNSISNDYQQ